MELLHGRLLAKRWLATEVPIDKIKTTRDGILDYARSPWIDYPTVMEFVAELDEFLAERV